MKLLLTVIFLLNLGLVQAQQTFLLKKGAPSETRPFHLEDNHHYEIEVGENQFLLVVLEQKGIDLMIEAMDPAGQLVASFDSPNGNFGPEIVTLSNTQKGKYTLIVKALKETEEITEGQYSIRLEKQEPVASTIPGKIDQLMAAWDRPDVPGAAIAVVQHEQVIFKKGYGSANLEYDQPLKASSIFQVASVSKQFTAFAIATLANQGKIALADDIRKYLPEVPNFGKTITVDHLVHHTSGLRDLFNFLSLAGWTDDDYVSKDHVLKMVANQKELNFEPGEEYLYCNTGYVLLAEIVNRVTGQPFPEWMQEHVFEPLKMENSFINDNYTRLIPGRAYAYFMKEGAYNNDLLVYSSIGETGLYTNVEDLAKWVLNFESREVGSPDVHQLILERGILNKGDTTAYAFGLGIAEYRGLKRIGHNGSHSGYRTYMGYFPDEHFGVIVFSNAGGSVNVAGKAMEITELYLGEKMKEKPAPQEMEAAYKLPAGLFEKYEGEYEIAPGFNVKIWKEDEKFMAQATGQSSFEIQPLADTTFVQPQFDIRVDFRLDADKEVCNQFALLQGGQTTICKRLDPFDADAVDLPRYTGLYFSEEAQTSYLLVVEDGKLLARHLRLGDIRLEPTKKNQFRGDTWFFGLVEFEWDNKEQLTGFRVSNGRARKVLFNRQER